AGYGTDPSGHSHSFRLSDAELDHFAVGAQGPSSAGCGCSVAVCAPDAFNNTVTGYTGTIHFTSPDGQAVLPANYPFVAGDNGSQIGRASCRARAAGTEAAGRLDTRQTRKTRSARATRYTAQLSHCLSYT